MAENAKIGGSQTRFLGHFEPERENSKSVANDPLLTLYNICYLFRILNDGVSLWLKMPKKRVCEPPILALSATFSPNNAILVNTLLVQQKYTPYNIG